MGKFVETAVSPSIAAGVLATGTPMEPTSGQSVPLPSYRASPGAHHNQLGLFDVLDRNHDGVLSRDEFSATIPYMYSASVPASYMPLPQNPRDTYGSSPVEMYGATP